MAVVFQSLEGQWSYNRELHFSIVYVQLPFLKTFMYFIISHVGAAHIKASVLISGYPALLFKSDLFY